MTFLDRARDVELTSLALLDRPPPSVMAELLEVARVACGASGARFNVLSSQHQHVLLDADGAEGVVPKEQAPCLRVIDSAQRTHLVPDAREDERFADLAFVTSGAIVGYASSQLVTSRGITIGTLCVFDAEPQQWDERARLTLERLAETASRVLEAERARESMAESLTRVVRDSDELQRSNMHLAAFAGQVSHDLLAPLSAVSLALELVDEQLEEDETDAAVVRGLVGSAVGAARRAQATVGGLLEFAGLGGRLRREPVDGAGLVDEVLVDLSARRGATTVVVDAVPPLLGDPVQLRAVVQNLLANAFTHADRPGVCVLVDGEHLGEVVRVRVHDSGPGVPPELRERIFARGARGDAARSESVAGHGIGLDTCRRIAASHGGRVGVETSQRLGGACFWLELPAAERTRGQLPEALTHAPTA